MTCDRTAPPGCFQCVRPAPGLPGYFVDRLGNFWSQKRRGSAKLTADLRKVKTEIHARHGYEIARPCVGGRVKVARLHRLVLKAFRGCPDESLQARHLNGDKLDNRIENLAWGTQSDNERDKRAHGRVRTNPNRDPETGRYARKQ